MVRSCAVDAKVTLPKKKQKTSNKQTNKHKKRAKTKRKMTAVYLEDQKFNFLTFLTGDIGKQIFPKV